MNWIDRSINVRNWITMVWFKSCKNVTLSTFLLSQNVLWGKYKISIKWWWNKYLQNNITDECFTFHWYYRNYIMQICMHLGSFIASSLYGWHMKVFRYRIVIDKFTLLLHFQSNDEDNTWFMDIIYMLIWYLQVGGWIKLATFW